MGNIFDEFLKKADAFQSKVESDLKQMRQCKRDIQQLKNEVYNKLQEGYYLRDDKRIVLSAPEIVIGNVDMAGTVMGGSTITLRGQQINLQGVGEGGEVNANAGTLRLVAEDKGDDGREAVVHPASSVDILARSVNIESNNSKDTFAAPLSKSLVTGLSLHSDSSLYIDASLSRKNLSDSIDKDVKQLTKDIASIKSSLTPLKLSLQKQVAVIDVALKAGDPMLTDNDTAIVSAPLIDTLGDKLEDFSIEFFGDLRKYINQLSALAEASRKKKALEVRKKELPSEGDYKKKTGANLTINSERVDITTRDGDYNTRTNENGIISLNAAHTQIGSFGDDKHRIEKSDITLHTENINLFTSDVKKGEEKEKTPMYESGGKLRIMTKDMEVQAVDYKEKDEKNPYHFEKLAEKGSIRFSAEKIDLATANEKGEIKGEVNVNSKEITLKSVDVDAEKLTDKKQGAGTKITLITENVLLGSKDNDSKTKKVQLVSEEINAAAEKTLELQQNSGKAGVRLDGGKVELGGDQTQVDGKTIIAGEAEIKGKTKMTDAEAQGMNVKTVLKAPNSNWGQGAAAPGSPSKYSAKLKEEDVKIKKQ